METVWPAKLSEWDKKLNAMTALEGPNAGELEIDGKMSAAATAKRFGNGIGLCSLSSGHRFAL